KKAGFEVNQSILDKLYAYLQQKLKDHETEDWYYWDEHGIARKQTVWCRCTFYSMFVLGLSGKSDQSAMNYYKSNDDMLTPDSKYMLAATFYLAGNKNSYKDLLPESWANLRS